MSGNVTPVQVAFIVDRYLSDHRFTKTLAVFRSEAASLLSSTKGKEAPKNLLSLSAILGEYISLKEQKVIVDQERCRVEALSQGIHSALQAYASAVPTIFPPPSGPSFSPPNQITPAVQCEPRKMGSPTPVIGHHTSNIPTSSKRVYPSPNPLRPATTSPSGIELPSKKKRKAFKSSSDPTPPKKKNGGKSTQGSTQVRGTRSTSKSNVSTAEIQTVNIDDGEMSSCQRSSLLCNSSKDSPLSDSTDPHTPPQSLPSPNEKAVTPLESSADIPTISKANASYVATPIDCQIVSTQTVVVSPFKHTRHYATDVTYRISPLGKSSDPIRIIKRDHVKGRLDFDDTNEATTSKRPISSEITYSESANVEVDMFGFPNLDVFGTDFSLADLLPDIDLDCEGVCPPVLDKLDPSTASGMMLESDNNGHNRTSFTALLTDNNYDLEGSEIVTSQSITKSITILSPMKKQTGATDEQDN